MKQPEKLMLAGDWHGNTPWARQVIDYAAENGCDTIVHLGDFGWWRDSTPTKHYLEAVQGYLRRAGITLYWVDGNHEDHSRIWDLNQPDIGGPFRISEHLPNILFLPRGLQWEWFGKTWMSVGGAVSVDKHHRTRDVDWWAEEELSDEQIEYCCRGPVDVIVSHDCPAGVFIPGLNDDHFPQWTLLDADIHRQKLRTIWDATGATELYHGHYHRAYKSYLSDGLVVGLDCDNTTMRDSTLIYNVEMN
jgi:hypothetical protein